MSYPKPVHQEFKKFKFYYREVGIQCREYKLIIGRRSGEVWMKWGAHFVLLGCDEVGIGLPADPIVVWPWRWGLKTMREAA